MQLSIKNSAVLALLGCTLVGCNAGSFPTEKAMGKVTCDGRPVANVLVYFEPVRTANSSIVGQQGFGLTDASGTFQITTYSQGDGAVLGKHKIRVGKTETSSACDCDLNPNFVLQEVDVQKGAANDFVFSLIPKAESTDTPALSEEEKEKEMDKSQ